MLLVVDIGNTHVVLGCYEGENLRCHWRLATDPHRTADEWMVMLTNLFSLEGAERDQIAAAIISSVVPPMTPVMEEVCRVRLRVPTKVVGVGLKTGMPIQYDNPKEVGADRVVNAVAAYNRWRCPLVIVDFGTATTFDAVSEAGAYLGGAIAPGLKISVEALSRVASMLPKVELVQPRSVIGRTTAASMQAGIVFGYAGLVDGLVSRMRQELGGTAKVVATGGLAPLVAKATSTIEHVDPFLSLDGLRLLHERNL